MAKPSLVVVDDQFTPSPEAAAASRELAVQRVLLSNIRRACLAALHGLNEREVFTRQDMAELALAFDELAKCARSMA